ELIAQTGAHYVVMYNRGNSKTMDALTDYDDLVADVVAETQQVVDDFIAAGVKEEQLIVDPGLGFSKSGDQNWQLLKNLEAFDKLGLPLLIGASRKRFLGKMLAEDPADPVEPRQRDHATAAITAQVADQGVWAVRVHYGVLDHERATGQIFVVDVVCQLDISQAAATDDVEATVNYAQVAAVVENIITGPPVNLIETLAATMADAILDQFALINSVQVTVNKPQAPIPADFANVAVTVTRDRND